MSSGSTRARGHIRWILSALPLGLLLVAALAASAAAQGPEPRIVGGQEADPGEWPWQVALIQAGGDTYNDQFCGGTLIDPYWVLTASHCTDGANPADIEVLVGIHDLVTPDAGYLTLPVAEIHMHPGYNDSTTDNDIALLKLAQPATYRIRAGDALPIAGIGLVAGNVGSLEGVTATVTGWGNTIAQPNPGGTNYPARLREVEVPIISQASCRSSYGQSTITDNMMCAGFAQGGKDSCQGDSGGPLVVFNSGTQKWELGGVVSWGTGCAQPNLPGVYTRVSRFVPWVDSIMSPTPPGNYKQFLPMTTNVPYVPPAAPLQNGNFEAGPTVWKETSAQGYDIITTTFPGSVAAHSGAWAAWLGGVDSEDSAVSQQVTVPAAMPVLRYYRWVASADICGYDFFQLRVNGTTVKTYSLCDATNDDDWRIETVNLSAYAGQSVNLAFRVTTDDSDNSNYFLDDVAFQAAAAVSDAIEAPTAGPAAGAALPKGGSAR